MVKMEITPTMNTAVHKARKFFLPLVCIILVGCAPDSWTLPEQWLNTTQAADPLPYSFSQQIQDIYNVDPDNEVCYEIIWSWESCRPVEEVIDSWFASGTWEIGSITTAPAQVLLSTLLDIHTNYTGWEDKWDGFIDNVDYDFNHLDIRKKVAEEAKKQHYNPYYWVAYGYLLWLEWSYDLSSKQMHQVCADYPSFCDVFVQVDITLSWSVFDQDKNPIEGTIITELNTGISALSDATWAYEIIVSTYTPKTLRYSAEKDGYSGGFFEEDITYQSHQTLTKDFQIYTYTEKIVTDKKQKKITVWEGNISEWFLTTSTHSSSYAIPMNSFIYFDGKKHNGKVSIYLYEFTPDDDINFLDSSIFTEARWYIWHQLITFGMPFVVFRDDDGNRIYLPESTPWTITYLPKTKVTFIQMQELTPDQITMLRDLSDKWGYPLTNDYTMGSTLFQGLPSFWNLDQRTGIWYDVGMKLLDDIGTIQAPIYTTRDSTPNVRSWE